MEKSLKTKLKKVIEKIKGASPEQKKAMRERFLREWEELKIMDWFKRELEKLPKKK